MEEQSYLYETVSSDECRDTVPLFPIFEIISRLHDLENMAFDSLIKRGSD